MEERLIKGRTNVLALEKGFDNTKRHLVDYTREYVDAKGEGTGEYYSEIKWVVGYVHPTQSLLQKWLREVHGINIIIVPTHACYNILDIAKYDVDHDINIQYQLDGLEFCDFESYEDALEAGLDTALKSI